MDDFDRFLEFELGRMLDPVVATRAPGRRNRRNTSTAPAVLLEIVAAPTGLVAEVIPAAVESAMPVQPAILLP